jgi:hypothetical protein
VAPKEKYCRREDYFPLSNNKLLDKAIMDRTQTISFFVDNNIDKPFPMAQIGVGSDFERKPRQHLPSRWRCPEKSGAQVTGAGRRTQERNKSDEFTSIGRPAAG